MEYFRRAAMSRVKCKFRIQVAEWGFITQEGIEIYWRDVVGLV